MSDLPDIDEVEVTLFGPGYGECCLIHLGDREWVIVDSCVDKSTGSPAGIQYLDDIGVDSAADVKTIIVSHYHDDHIRGISETLRCCPNARLFTSVALQDATLVKLIMSHNQRLRSESGLKEIDRIFDEMEASHKSGTQRLNFANHNQLLMRRENAPDYEVWSLSPSSAQIQKGLLELRAYFDDMEVPVRASPSSPNHFSIVLWVRVEDQTILLGGDLEETKDKNVGWSAIVSNAERPSGKAEVFKVPHHGSKNAHCDDVWSEMLVEDPLAIIAPFTRSKSPPPTRDDIDRIGSLTDQGFITAVPKKSRSKKTFDPVVRRKLREMQIKLRNAEPPIGMVRARKKSGSGNWDIELGGGACHLSDA